MSRYTVAVEGKSVLMCTLDPSIAVKLQPKLTKCRYFAEVAKINIPLPCPDGGGELMKSEQVYCGSTYVPTTVCSPESRVLNASLPSAPVFVRLQRQLCGDACGIQHSPRWNRILRNTTSRLT